MAFYENAIKLCLIFGTILLFRTIFRFALLFRFRFLPDFRTVPRFEARVRRVLCRDILFLWGIRDCLPFD